MNTSVLEKLNPYADSTDTLRLSIDVDRADAFTLYSILMERGAVRSALALYIKHLVNYAKQNGLTIDTIHRDKLLEYIAVQCGVDLDTFRRAAGSTNGQRPDDVVGRGVEAVRPGDQSTSNKPATRKRKPTSASADKVGSVVGAESNRSTTPSVG